MCAAAAAMNSSNLVMVNGAFEQAIAIKPNPALAEDMGYSRSIVCAACTQITIDGWNDSPSTHSLFPFFSFLLFIFFFFFRLVNALFIDFFLSPFSSV